MAASPLRVQPHPAKGRALHAARAFAPGQTLHAFADPPLLLPARALVPRLCARCLRPGRPRACSRCRAASYCGPTCQAAAWAAGHATECRALRRRPAAAAVRLPAPVCALVQALLRPDVAAALAPLEGHVRRPAGALQAADLDLMARAACAFAGVSDAQIPRAVELLCKIQVNAFNRYDADLGQIGIFLEPTLAMANHSCVPNATVQFIGRTAILVAERPIEAGDEIEISYTDYTYPLSKRREALAAYCFECRCPRCRDDLNVYQVCAAFPGAPPDGLSLVLEPSSLQSHPAIDDPAKQALARADGESATRRTESRTTPESLPERRSALLAHCRDCKGLTAGELWAVTPVPQVLTDISIYYAEEGNFASALAVACFVASACDPYRYVSHCQPVRANNIFVMAKLLANTAEGTAALSTSVTSAATRANLDQEVQEALRDIDQVALCQMLLIMVLRLAPTGHAQDWELAVAAREMLRDIEQLPGRDRELSLINAWAQDPAGDQSRTFFGYAVVQQVGALASLGRAVLKRDFGVGA